jgi:DNA-binding MarR family transcriptional regulator
MTRINTRRPTEKASAGLGAAGGAAGLGIAASAVVPSALEVIAKSIVAYATIMSQAAMRNTGPEDDSYIGYMLSDVARLIRTIFDRRVRDIGLTRAQWLVLTRVYRRPGVSQTELAEMLEIDRASAGRMIDRMERNGWVERRPDRTDRRINRLHLTDEARKVHAAMWAIAESTVDDALSPLSATEREQYAELTAKVKGRLQNLAGAVP